MERESRVKKTLLNVRINMICYFATLLVSFFTRKFFLDKLGTDFIGLTGTVGSLLGFLNLAELGIGTAIGSVLFKPVFDMDKEKINEIVSVLGYLYKCVGLAILAGGVILSGFLPLIFKDTPFPMYLIYLIYYTYLASSLIGYFVNYRSSLLGADQKGYLVTGYFQLSTFAQILAQVLQLFFIKSFVLYILIKLAFSIINSIILNTKINKTYPWLKTDAKLGHKVLSKYPEITKYVKQIFVHKIGRFAHNQIMPVLIYGYTSLTMVALLSNYTMLVDKIKGLLGNVLDSTGSSIGNLIAEGNQEKTYAIYKELYTVRFFASAITGFAIWYLATPFVKVWLGDEYVMSDVIVILISLDFALSVFEGIHLTFGNGYKLFSDTWIPFVRVASLAFVLLGGKLWGLPGLLGVKLSTTILIHHIWKPYFLYSQGLKRPFMEFILLATKNFLAVIPPVIIAFALTHWYNANVVISNQWLSWIVEATVFTGSMTLCTFAVYYSCFKHFRFFFQRILKLKR